MGDHPHCDNCWGDDACGHEPDCGDPPSSPFPPELVERVARASDDARGKMALRELIPTHEEVERAGAVAALSAFAEWLRSDGMRGRIELALCNHWNADGAIGEQVDAVLAAVLEGAGR